MKARLSLEITRFSLEIARFSLQIARFTGNSSEGKVLTENSKVLTGNSKVLTGKIINEVEREYSRYLLLYVLEIDFHSSRNKLQFTPLQHSLSSHLPKKSVSNTNTHNPYSSSKHSYPR